MYSRPQILDPGFSDLQRSHAGGTAHRGLVEQKAGELPRHLTGHYSLKGVYVSDQVAWTGGLMRCRGANVYAIIGARLQDMVQLSRVKRTKQK